MSRIESGSDEAFEETLTTHAAPISVTAQTVGVHTDLARQVIQDRLFGSQPTAKIGRFTIQRRLGAGAMGVVYLCRDAELDRDVAVKLLRIPGQSPASWAATLAEGRSLAKLRHPNVVTVHEIGEQDGSPYVVMEYVEGGSLRDWVAGDRSRTELVRILIELGRGLNAVHRAGLVHRDVKPDNVLITTDGRPVLADFGLVETAPDLHRTLVSGGESEQARGRGLAGTPAYLAPEVWAGATVGPETDQFAFGVMAWELLCGSRPFEADNVPALARKILASEFEGPERLERLPRHLARAIRRMLAQQPESRFADMAVATRALEVDPRRRVAIAAITAVVAAGLLALGWTQGRVTVVEHDPCASAGEDAEALWTDATRERLATHLRASNSAIAEDQWQRAQTRVASWMTTHVAISEQVCRTSQGFGLAGVEQTRPKLACLDRKVFELRAVLAGIEALAPANASVRAVPALAGLEDASECLTATGFDGSDAPVELPAELEASLAQLSASALLRRDDETTRLADALIEEGRSRGLREVEALALLARARVHDQAGDAPAATNDFEVALALALGLGDHRLQLRAWVGLLSVHGINAASPEVASLVATVGDRLLAQPEFEVPRLRAEFLNLRAQFELARGDLTLGRATAVEALAAAQSAFAADDPALGRFQLSWGISLWTLGEQQPALEAFEAAIAQFSSTLGPDHPSTLTARENRVNLLTVLRRLDEARAEHQAIRDLRIAALGPDHLEVAGSHAGLAGVEFAAKRPDLALEHLEAALAIYDQHLGPASRNSLTTRANIALVLARLGRHEDALATARDQLRVVEAEFGPDHPDVVLVHEMIGSELAQFDRLDEAEQAFLRSIEIGARVLPPNHDDLAVVRLGYAGFLVDRRRWAEAREQAELALAAREISFGPTSPKLQLPLEILVNVAEGERRTNDARALADRLAALED